MSVRHVHGSAVGPARINRELIPCLRTVSLRLHTRGCWSYTRQGAYVPTHRYQRRRQRQLLGSTL
ncbi:hypothetical protein PssvBMR18_gp09 [Pseudomonas phage MR18]|nr:hypothetical protein PssvBMR18_gp09 [Pseudomonas phage MR18]